MFSPPVLLTSPCTLPAPRLLLALPPSAVPTPPRRRRSISRAGNSMACCASSTSGDSISMNLLDLFGRSLGVSSTQLLLLPPSIPPLWSVDQTSFDVLPTHYPRITNFL